MSWTGHGQGRVRPWRSMVRRILQGAVSYSTVLRPWCRRISAAVMPLSRRLPRCAACAAASRDHSRAGLSTRTANLTQLRRFEHFGGCEYLRGDRSTTYLQELRDRAGLGNVGIVSQSGAFCLPHALGLLRPQRRPRRHRLLPRQLRWSALRDARAALELPRDESRCASFCPPFINFAYCRQQQAAQCRAGVLVGERLQIGRISAEPAEDLAKQHRHHHRAHQREGVKARIAAGLSKAGLIRWHSAFPAA